MRTPMVLAAALLLATPAVLAGCAAMNPLPQLGFDPAVREEKDIAERMRLFTARVETYREFRTVFTARALFLAPEVRQAAAAWEAKSRLLDPAETAAASERIVASAGDRVEFLVGFYAPDDGKNRLEAPAGGWEIYLGLADGRRFRASCLLAGEQESVPYMRFLRWDLSWSRLYLVCFPVSPADPALARGMTLVIAGPDGNGEMALTLPNPTVVSPSTLSTGSGSSTGSGPSPPNP